MPSHSDQPTRIAAPLRAQHKVAIPRLQTSSQLHTSMKDRRRVPRACTAVSLNLKYWLLGSTLRAFPTIPSSADSCTLQSLDISIGQVLTHVLPFV